MLKRAFQYGLITAFLGFIWIIGEYFIGLHTSRVKYHPFITMFAIFIPIIVTIYSFRKEKQIIGKGITFMHLLQFSIVTSLISAVFSLGFQLIYTELVNPNFYQGMIDNTIIEQQKSGMAISKAKEIAESYFNQKSYMIQILTSGLFTGAFIGLITAWRMTRKTLSV
jgi:hypothetical protein